MGKNTGIKQKFWSPEEQKVKQMEEIKQQQNILNDDNLSDIEEIPQQRPPQFFAEIEDQMHVDQLAGKKKKKKKSMFINKLEEEE